MKKFILGLLFMFLVNISLISKTRWVEGPSITPGGCAAICATKGLLPTGKDKRKGFLGAVLDCECEGKIIDAAKDAVSSVGAIVLDASGVNKLKKLIEERIKQVKSLISNNTKALFVNKDKLMKEINELQSQLDKNTLPEIKLIMNDLEEIGAISQKNISKFQNGLDIMGILTTLQDVNPVLQKLYKKIDDLSFKKELTSARDAVENLHGIFWEGASIRTGIINILSEAEPIMNALKGAAGEIAKLGLPGLDSLKSILETDKLLEFLKSGKANSWKEGPILSRLTDIKNDLNTILSGDKAFKSSQNIVSKLIEKIISSQIDISKFNEEMQGKAKEIQDILSNKDFNYRKQKVQDLADKLGKDFDNLKIDFSKLNLKEIPKTYNIIEQDIKDLISNSADMLTYIYVMVQKSRSLIDSFEKKLDVKLFTEPVNQGLFKLENHINDEINVLSQALKQVYNINYERPKV